MFICIDVVIFEEHAAASVLTDTCCHQCLQAAANLKRCTRCRMSTYCTPECQKLHYRSHKKECDATAQLDAKFRKHFDSQSLLAARIVMDLIERRGATERFDELMALQTHADKFPSMTDINKRAGVPSFVLLNIF